ncbi:MAG: S28 family serine protease, partial [Dermatophilaceae bacterium]
MGVVPAAATSSPVTAGTAISSTTSTDDIAERLAAIDGMRVVSRSEQPSGQTYFVLTYRQPVDHRRPAQGSFEQRLSLLHTGTDRPMVLHTSGYGLSDTAFSDEPTTLLGANQVSTEQRYFAPSRPTPTDWEHLTIWQAASDHHRIVEALRPIYPAKWISTGASKGGMTSVYHRRFYPDDVDGTVAYVAPNDVDNARDRYVPFIQQIGDDDECNAALRRFQRAALERRSALVALVTAEAKKDGRTFSQSFGSVDRVVEAAILDAPFSFWQNWGPSLCPRVPGDASSDQEIYDFIDEILFWSFYSDQGVEFVVPYFYQAARQTGWPNVAETPWLADLQRYREARPAAIAVPPSIRPRFEPGVMRDIDRWVRTRGSELLFVYGEDDPWSAEPFRLGPGTRDSAVYYQPGGDHGSTIAGLDADDE